MFSLKFIVLVAAAFIINVESSAVPSVAAVAATPLVAPAQVGYAHAVPQNIPPYAAQLNVVNKALLAAPAFAAAPAIATPFAAPVVGPVPYAGHLAAPVAAPLAAPVVSQFAAPVAAPLAASPYLAGPGVFAAPYAAALYSLPASYATTYPYGPAPLVRSPYGLAPAFVR